MNWQLFPDSCGVEVAKAWCPLTYIPTLLICIGFSLITTFILLCWIIPYLHRIDLRRINDNN
jgi:hypothetical protein